MCDFELNEDFRHMLSGIPGLNANALCDALMEQPSVALRRNRRKIPADGLPAANYADSKPVSWCDEDGLYLTSRPTFTLNPLLHAGAFYVQDASSMIYQQVLSSLIRTAGMSAPDVLDFCAAPGGKTTAIINALPDHGAIVANEFVAERGKVLRENLEKWGFPNVITTGASSSDYARLPETFDIIAVDAPCSGEGMMRKDATARSQWSTALVENCSALQREILTDLATTLKPGGFLIYSTCTFNTLENEQNSLFISSELGFTPVSIDSLKLHGIAAPSRALIPGVEALRFMQHLSRGEGLYISIFRKPGEWRPSSESLYTEPDLISPRQGKKEKAPKGRDSKSKNLLTQDIIRQLSEWFNPAFEMQFQENKGLITALPGRMTALLRTLRKADIRITAAGLPAAEIKGKNLIPDSRIALSLALRPDAFPKADLNEADALRFLRRESFPLPNNIPTGFIVITYRGIPLGMMKNLGSRANNLYPQPWKIRIN